MCGLIRLDWQWPDNKKKLTHKCLHIFIYVKMIKSWLVHMNPSHSKPACSAVTHKNSSFQVILFDSTCFSLFFWFHNGQGFSPAAIGLLLKPKKTTANHITGCVVFIHIMALWNECRLWQMNILKWKLLEWNKTDLQYDLLFWRRAGWNNWTVSHFLAFFI